MKRVYVYIIGVMLTMGVQAQTTYHRADSIKISQLLQEASRHASPLSFARQFLGVPYVAHTLEVNDKEQLVVNTRGLDCTTLVETVTALTLCVERGQRSWDDYLNMLRSLRYRDGVLNGYPSRLHYFSDWIVNKEAMGYVTEVQEPNPPFTAEQVLDINFMSQHPQMYVSLTAHPEQTDMIRQQEEKLTGKTFRFIPKSALLNTRLLRSVIKDGDIIAITCNKKGLDIAHLGFAMWKNDGLHFLHASYLRKKVVEEPQTLYRYLQKQPSHTGIRIVRLKR